MTVEMQHVIGVLDQADRIAPAAGTLPDAQALLRSVQATGTTHSEDVLKAAVHQHLEAQQDQPLTRVQGKAATPYRFGWARPKNPEGVRPYETGWRYAFARWSPSDEMIWGVSFSGLFLSATAGIALKDFLPLGVLCVLMVGSSLGVGLIIRLLSRLSNRLWRWLNASEPAVVSDESLDRYLNCASTRAYLRAIAQSDFPQILSGDGDRLHRLYSDALNQAHEDQREAERRVQLDQQAARLSQLA